VNEQGVVVGDGWDQNEYAWIYSDDTARELLVPRGYKSARALGVNADGDVVGTASDTDGQVVVVRWPATDLDRPSTLTGLAGMILTPAGITDDGRIVATIGQDGRDRGVYMWEADGIGRTLPMPPGAIGGYVTTVHGDWAAGAAYIPPASGEAVQPTPHTDGRGDVVVDVPVRWNLTTSTVDFLLDSTDGDVGRASAVTADGNVLLEAEESIFIRDDQRYVLSTSGGQARPTAVSGDGSVFVGVVVTTRPGSAEVVRQPTLWRC
jgi:uncharacterized membrane protein